MQTLELLNLEDLMQQSVSYFVIEIKDSRIYWDLAGYLIVAEEPIVSVGYGKWVPKSKEEILSLWDERIGTRTGIFFNCEEKITIEAFRAM